MILDLPRLFPVSTPLTLADVLWFHPPEGDNVCEALHDDVDLFGRRRS